MDGSRTITSALTLSFKVKTVYKGHSRDDVAVMPIYRWSFYTGGLYIQVVLIQVVLIQVVLIQVVLIQVVLIQVVLIQVVLIYRWCLYRYMVLKAVLIYRGALVEWSTLSVCTQAGAYMRMVLEAGFT